MFQTENDKVLFDFFPLIKAPHVHCVGVTDLQ